MTSYYALIDFEKGETIKNCSSIARYKNGLFEKLENKEWVEDTSLFAIFIGEFWDYQSIDEITARKIIKRLS